MIKSKMISIHAPRVGRDRCDADRIHRTEISIHAPRVGRDPTAKASVPQQRQFQSTRPVWGATYADWLVKTIQGISIHAPRVGRDLIRKWIDIYIRIYPVAPRVGRDF